MADSQVTISASVVHVDTRTTSKIIVLPPVEPPVVVVTEQVEMMVSGTM